ncbi:hypothetical protein ACR78Z_05495 [Sphingobacterium thalpophilum]|uniref:hypothetical protein n=1 Tax=Sphingobacterium thalpophilum TaxID=259 RepID=UPI003DA21BE8
MRQYEIKLLFEDLGIDYKKECEVWHYCNDELGDHRYSGWFHFKGSFQDKNYVSQTNEICPIIDLVPINENFSIGFSENNKLTSLSQINVAMVTHPAQPK